MTPDPATSAPPGAGPYRACVGIGGIGSGLFFALDGNHTLGRNESRPGRLLNVRDYCKLHIIAHYVAVFLGARPSGDPFGVFPIGKIGRDAAGERLLGEMRAAGMDTRFVEMHPDLPTMLSVCFQYPDGAGGNITTSESAASAISPEDMERALDAIPSGNFPFVALAAPEAPLEARRRFLEKAGTRGAFCAASFTSAEMPMARDAGLLARIDLLAMNEDEARALAGAPPEGGEPRHLIEAAAGLLLLHNRNLCLVVTAGMNGAFATHRGVTSFCPALEVPVASTAGAGDALLGGMIAGMVAGMPLVAHGPPEFASGARTIASAFEFACLLAAFTITSPHTIHPGADPDSLFAFARHMGMVFDRRLFPAPLAQRRDA